MKKMSIVGLISGAVLGLVLAGAMLLAGGVLMSEDATAASPSGSTEEIQGSWVLTSWSDPSKLPDVPITMNVEDGLVNGISACNNYSGPLTLNGDSWETGLMAMTMMYCMDTAEAETTYLALLDSATSWVHEGESLVLSANGSEVLRFNKA